MNDADTMPRHMLDVRELTAEAFAPYGQVIEPLRTGGQSAETGYDPETSASEAKLVLGNGEPRLWIMHLPYVGLGFARIARHRRVTQCLGSLGDKEWFIGVAPPGDLGDDARPRIEDIAAFRVPGDRLIKLHVATWHAGPISSTTSACSSILKTSTPTGGIFTPSRFRSSAGTSSETHDARVHQHLGGR